MFSRQNLYPGINAHLNSWLQAESGRWLSFHSDHITFLVSVLNADLPPGYIVRGEQSLQISETNLTTGQTIPYQTRPDALVSRLQSKQPQAPTASGLATELAMIPLPDTFPADPEDDLTGIVIYRVTGSGDLGTPVTRIELLSPSNKPGCQGYKSYLVGRWRSLHSGLNLVEIDYLHQLPPISPALPRYPDGANSTPFYVLVNQPHPSFQEGQTRIFGWHATQPLPRIPIPLQAHPEMHSSELDLATAYERTFANNDRLYETILNYAQEPLDFFHYSTDNQKHIKSKPPYLRERNADDTP